MGTNIEVLDILNRGLISIKGEFLWGSNYTFLVEIEWEGEHWPAVYKPTRGERPLWDFPPATLAKREVAAYLVSQSLGWDLVPPTVYRRRAPFGPGSIQLFVEHDPEYHYFTFSAEDRQRLRPVALFDIVINNADRKGGHILKDTQGRLWLIDHGICFHVEDKLRTVVWDFAGEPIPSNLCSDLSRLLDELGETNSVTPLVRTLSSYLHRDEIQALRQRVKRLLAEGHFPLPDPYRRAMPWPRI